MASFSKLALSALALAAVSYLYYIKRCYGYLSSLGYDGPPPSFLVGNLADFASPANSYLLMSDKSDTTAAHPNATNSNTAEQFAHYSRTLFRWTQTYGKIYGYYEGHTPIIVIADPDLVIDVFANQEKAKSFRRSFPMSHESDEPDSNIFLNNGIRWVRVRYGLEKVMLNNKNIARCLEYVDESFKRTFLKQLDLKKYQRHFAINKRTKLFMVRTMFSVLFGTDFDEFVKNHASFHDCKPDESESNLEPTKYVAKKFDEAFLDFESFSMLKFLAIIFPELTFVWKRLEVAKKTFNKNVLYVKCFADPMDWFQMTFINKHLELYSTAQAKKKPTSSTSTSTSSSQRRSLMRGFGLFSSFLSLTLNPIVKYNQKESPYRKISVSKETPKVRRYRAFTVTSDKQVKQDTNCEENSASRSRASSISKVVDTIRARFFSIDNDAMAAPTRSAEPSGEPLNKKSSPPLYQSKLFLNEFKASEYETWKLTINEALSNTLLMFFGGYETTASALTFCCSILSTHPEQREKLLDEIREYWEELSCVDVESRRSFNFLNTKAYSTRTSAASYFLNREDRLDKLDESNVDEPDIVDVDDDDDVFDSTPTKEYTPPNVKRSASYRHRNSESMSNTEKLSTLNDTLEKMKYLDMFVKEVLRMFPIASSMVSRKCVEDEFRIGNGSYLIPKGTNIVVDVLSIHYDAGLWGPVDPELFYPERFLTDRNPAAWLPFGIGCRKCLGIKLAMSQIKLFIVRLLQSYKIDKPSEQQQPTTSATTTTDDFFIALHAAKSNHSTTATPATTTTSEIKQQKPFNQVKTKEILFNTPIEDINISIEPKHRMSI